MVSAPSPQVHSLRSLLRARDLDERAVVRVGPIAVDPPVVLAPMAGVTNAPFRTLCRRFGAGLYVSEMITARALVEANAKTMLMASFAEGESPRSIQLYGVDPATVGAAVERLVEAGRVDHVDLNFGCPAPKVTKLGGGAALPVRRRLAASIIRAAVAAAGDVPVTVNCRSGGEDDHHTLVETCPVDEARIGNVEYEGMDTADYAKKVQLLLAKCADPKLKNKAGQSAQSIAPKWFEKP